MPVIKCPNGKYRIGSGMCMYESKETAESAYRGYLMSMEKSAAESFVEELLQKVDGNEELKSIVTKMAEEMFGEAELAEYNVLKAHANFTNCEPESAEKLAEHDGTTLFRVDDAWGSYWYATDGIQVAKLSYCFKMTGSAKATDFLSALVGYEIGETDIPKMESEMADVSKNMKDYGWKTAFKSEKKPESDPELELESKIVLKSAKKQVAYCEVLIPDEVMAKAQDGFTDKMNAEEIEKTAWRYLQTRMAIKIQGHFEKDSDNSYPVESYIAPVDMEMQDDPSSEKKVIKKGTWVIGIKTDSPEVWKKIEDGEITGVSVGGLTRRVLAS